MAKKKNFIGGWAFLVGLILAIVISIVGVNAAQWPIYVLATLGIIVGLFNVTGKEVIAFLIASIAFVVTFQSLATVLGKIPGIGNFLSNFFMLMVVFVAPAAAVVAISALLAITKD